MKRALARNIVAAYHDEEAAAAAEADFDLKFKEHGFPADAPVFEADLTPNDEGKVYFARFSSMRALPRASPRPVVSSTAAP